MADKVSDSNRRIGKFDHMKRGYHTAVFISALYQELCRQLPSATPRAVIDIRA